MKQLFILLFVVLSAMSSCNYSEEPIQVDTKIGLSLALPPYVKKTDRLSEDAIIQYENKFRTFYTLLLNESETNSVIALKKATDQLKGVMRKPVLENFQAENDHFKFHSQKITGYIDDENFVYYIGIFAHENKLYQLVVWTKREKMDSFGTDIENVFRSLQVQ